ncbi:hypothetical protein [Pelagibaculum spongiae]|nr:hypothetical protein [Pelagibaculum spongiae]
MTALDWSDQHSIADTASIFLRNKPYSIIHPELHFRVGVHTLLSDQQFNQQLNDPELQKMYAFREILKKVALIYLPLSPFLVIFIWLAKTS